MNLKKILMKFSKFSNIEMERKKMIKVFYLFSRGNLGGKKLIFSQIFKSKKMYKLDDYFKDKSRKVVNFLLEIMKISGHFVCISIFFSFKNIIKLFYQLEPTFCAL